MTSGQQPAQEACGCSCAEIQSALCALFDPSTPEDRAQALLEQIAKCPQCYGRLESERDIRVLLKQCCYEQSAPETLRQRITMQITQISVTRR